MLLHVCGCQCCYMLQQWFVTCNSTWFALIFITLAFDWSITFNLIKLCKKNIVLWYCSGMMIDERHSLALALVPETAPGPHHRWHVPGYIEGMCRLWSEPAAQGLTCAVRALATQRPASSQCTSSSGTRMHGRCVCRSGTSSPGQRNGGLCWSLTCSNTSKQ